jgi:hypothetical protein
MHQVASKVYGRGLWDKKFLVAEGVVANDIKKPLAADADPRKLAGPALYFQRNRFGDVQLLIKYAEDGWSYASILRDKDGEQILSDDNKYEIHEVECLSRFEVPNVTNEAGEKVVIEKGFQTLKAYAM